eukprot:5629854-Pyramimonas_sp.AAC.2
MNTSESNVNLEIQSGTAKALKVHLAYPAKMKTCQRWAKLNITTRGRARTRVARCPHARWMNRSM